MIRKPLHILLSLGVLLSITVTSCYQDGENPYVLWDKYSESGQQAAFSFYYLSPPFTIATDVRDEKVGASPLLIVDRYEAETADGLHGRIEVWAEVCEKGARDEAWERGQFWSGEYGGQARYFSYVNYFGDTGVMLLVEWENIWLKEIYYDYRGGCVRMTARTDERASREDIELLLASFRPGPDDERDTDG